MQLYTNNLEEKRSSIRSCKAPYEDTREKKECLQDQIKCARNMHGFMTMSYGHIFSLDGARL
jgi:hypothetical protein